MNAETPHQMNRDNRKSMTVAKKVFCGVLRVMCKKFRQIKTRRRALEDTHVACNRPLCLPWLRYLLLKLLSDNKK